MLYYMKILNIFNIFHIVCGKTVNFTRVCYGVSNWMSERKDDWIVQSSLTSDHRLNVVIRICSELHNILLIMYVSPVTVDHFFHRIYGFQSYRFIYNVV